MDQTTAIWTPHLKPGERIVWSAQRADALVRAAHARQRTISGLIMLAATLAAAVFALNFLDAAFQKPQGGGFQLIPNMTMPGLVMAPLYLAFCVTCIVVAIAQGFRLNPKPPAAAHFAATSQRLIALGASGAIIDELPADEVSTVIAGGRRKTPDIYVLRKDDEKEELAFAIEYIDKPLEAKAIIEQTFLESAP